MPESGRRFSTCGARPWRVWPGGRAARGCPCLKVAAGFQPAGMGPVDHIARGYPCPSPDVRLGPPGRGSLHVRCASASCLRLLP